MQAPRTVALACGGTAGHVYPALALADELERELPGARVLFLGTRHGIEGRLVPEQGRELAVLPGSPFVGTGAAGKARAIGELLVGFLRARRLFRERRPDVVIGFGGYASAGALFAAASLGIPAAIHESNIVPGLANRMLAGLADRIYLGSAAARWRLPEGKALVTGTPVRREIASACGPPALPGSPLRFLVTGGSGGSDFLNRRAPELLRSIQDCLGTPVQVLHQSGGAPDEVAAAYRAAKVAAEVVPYVDEMASAYAEADFVIATSGAGTLAELVACGKPSLLVPLGSAANGHQRVNAEAMAAAEAAWCVGEDGSPQELAPAIAGLLRDRAAYQRASRRVRALALPDAARAIARDVARLV